MREIYRKIYRRALSIALTTSISFGSGYLLYHHIAKQKQKQAERIVEIEKKVQYALGEANKEIYFSEGMQFSPGGGYFYLSDGMSLSEEKREEISDRIKEKEQLLYSLERRIEGAFHPEKEDQLYFP